jgi:hypothetical protein
MRQKVRRGLITGKNFRKRTRSQAMEQLKSTLELFTLSEKLLLLSTSKMFVFRKGFMQFLWFCLDHFSHLADRLVSKEARYFIEQG